MSIDRAEKPKFDGIGKVFLVGAGPGDPGLLTLRGKECLRKASVVVYDRLISPRLLDFAPSEAERIYVGKEPGDHVFSQDEINEILVQKAREGKTVVRLKGGDPFVFGRGGEEALYLYGNGIPFEIVPGVSSAFAVPAYVGIPVTDRRLSSSVAVITGHLSAAHAFRDAFDLDRLMTAATADTIVFLMGTRSLSGLVSALKKKGMNGDTPVAVISRGTTSRQMTLVGTLDDIVQKAKSVDILPPSVIVVGKVVELRPFLSWAEGRPLFGKRIVVTRDPRQAPDLCTLIEEAGGEVYPFPVITVEPVRDMSRLHCAVHELERYSGVIFTSQNGVKYFFEELFKQGLDSRSLSGKKIGAIGPVTASVLKGYGIVCDVVPCEFRSESLLRALGSLIRRGDRVLLPRAVGGSDVLVKGLRGLGVEVDAIPIYKTSLPSDATRRAPELKRFLKQREIDAITFMSSTSVYNFVNVVGKDDLNLLDGVVIGCIGPETAKAAEGSGLRVNFSAQEYTARGLVRDLIRYFKGADCDTCDTSHVEFQLMLESDARGSK